ncbi:inorganic polyphosphate kinase [Prosthecomicrobium hirschii]|uniref:Inorganic polyphosphate kinase n=1 Tax=Prosthecodimorpha hirschii TaxID=665126 RepID=A0A0P6W6W8_9HYPH|nr:NAD(+)/NADH kinase [Prosthecomicrobium hirschii]KPL54322.1 inorganic polyphosphate kinase [Prosthecomicrobium hirschii]
MAVLTPRIVIVRRETDLDRVRATHASMATARFVLERRGLSLEAVEAEHAAFTEVLRRVRAAIPADWRQAMLMRAEVERFVFGPEDVVVAVGQDGLVANVAKYLTGQTVVGIDPRPGRNAGVLVRFRVEAAKEAIAAAAAGRLTLEARTMAEVRLESGERLTALNEIYLGHRTHQSARYRIAFEGASERQSSSGLIVATGTGATGWASSIARATGRRLDLAPTDAKLQFLVREAWASPSTGADLVAGTVTRAPVTITSEMDEEGTIFADGIESDRLAFPWGRIATVAVAEQRLMLGVG